MIRALALGLLLVSATTHAYDSRCYVGADPCHDGPQSARKRWIGPSDEHRQLWVETFNRSGVGTATTAPIDDFTLEVFAADDVVPEGTGQSIPTLTPVAFDAAERVHGDRTMSAGEFAQLPDFGYALWDWATGFETCPLGIPAPLDACHAFRTHMGTVNSNHFLPQAQAFYAYYHQLALGRAAACKTMKDRIVARGGQPATFQAFLDACAQEAFALEAVGHHFLQDAWSTGHMWERWGSPDLADFTDLQQALLIAMTSGLIHGARGVLQDVLGFAGFDVNDPLCAPGTLIRFIPGPITATVAGLGDLYLDQLLNQSGAAFPSQYLQLFSCAATSLRQVDRALGDEPGPIDPALIEVDDPTGSACFAQRVTNGAMREGMGIDMTTPGGLPVRIELDSAQAMALVPAASAAIGGSLQNVNPIINAQYDFDVARMVTRARLQASLHPDATNLASGGLPPLLGIEKNSAFVRQPLATYVDPPLPWPGSSSVANDAATRSLALARTFHAAHATDWCNRFGTGAPDDLEGLRAHVHVLQAAGIGGEDLKAACRACTTFVARGLRVGTGENDYDQTREPLCRFIADDPDAVQYVYQEGQAGEAIELLAGRFCGAGRANGKIVFEAGGLATIAPDGLGLAAVPGTTGARRPAVSPDGTLIAVDGIRTFDFSGANSRQLAPGAEPAWSPDGTEIVFQQNFDLWIMAADGSDAPRPLTSAPEIDQAPSWSPTGERIAFVSDRSGESQVWTIAPDGTAVRQITAVGHVESERPSWSPDGSQLVYAIDDGTIVDLFVTSANVAVPDPMSDQRITTNGSGAIFNDSPAWSPDGTRIAFSSTRTGAREIWTLAAPNGGDERQVTTTGGRSPDWQPLALCD
jgi:WD40 repeat protein